MTNVDKFISIYLPNIGETVEAHIDPDVKSGKIDPSLIEGLVAGKVRLVRKDANSPQKRRPTVFADLDFQGDRQRLRLNVVDRSDKTHKLVLGQAFLEAFNVQLAA